MYNQSKKSNIFSLSENIMKHAQGTSVMQILWGIDLNSVNLSLKHDLNI